MITVVQSGIGPCGHAVRMLKAAIVAIQRKVIWVECSTCDNKEVSQ